jgi:glycosyltransferase involved in cell wall biosynthesis
VNTLLKEVDQLPRGVEVAAPGEGLLLVVALPALDEESTITEVIAAIPRRLLGIRTVEILVVDDGSTDRTAPLARAAGAEVVSHSQTQGVGAAFHTALQRAIERGADLLVTLDADGQFDPRDIPLLLEQVVSGNADFATASRFKDPALVPDMPWAKRFGNSMMSWLISRLLGQPFSDVSCGFRCYGQRAMLNLHLLGRFTYTQEVLMNLAFKRLRIVEVPLRVRGVRAHGRSRVARSLVRYAFRALHIILSCYRDFHPLRFFGVIALVLLVPGLGLGTFLLWHYLSTGALSPHKWAGFASAALLILSLVLLLVGVIGDMIARLRAYLEEVLYYHRRDNPLRLIDGRQPQAQSSGHPDQPG